MRFDGKTNKQKATDLKISKLSVCATPAHEGALATIIKEAAVTEEDQLNNNQEGETEMNEEQIAKMIADAVAKVEGKLEKAESLAKMNDATKVHYYSLNDADKETFMKATETERETIMWKAGINKEDVVKKVEDDETFTSNGTTIQKSVVGEGVFNLMKSQQEQIEKANKAAAIEKEKRELQDFVKQAEMQYPNLPGEVENKGMVMKSISTMPTEARETLSTMLKAGNEAMESANLYKEIGSDGTPMDDGSPLSKLNKMAENRAKTEGISEAVAYTAILDTPEGNALYQQSLKS